MRRFYNYIATIYSLWTQEIKGSLVESRTIKYDSIKIALWKNTKSYRESTLAVQTDSNQFEINLEPSHTVDIWDLVSLSLWEYKIDQVIEHHDHRGRLENIQAFISPTTIS